MTELFNVAGIRTATRAEGPGLRMVVWFQGCDIRCPGCCNPGLQPLEPRRLMTTEDLLVAASEAKALGAEGVTLLGGEPTLQAGLPALCSALQGMGLGVILFTGRRFEDLDPELVGSVDLVVDGEFLEDQPDGARNLVGSRNQRIVDVSGRYAGSMGWFNEPRPLRVEVSVAGDELLISGDVLRRRLAQRPLNLFETPLGSCGRFVRAMFPLRAAHRFDLKFYFKFYLKF